MKNNFSIKYDITKVANDLYSVYNTTDKTSSFETTKGLCDFIVEKRGGVTLNKSFYDVLESMESSDSFSISDDALKINKQAKFQGIEPWKLANIDGQEVFISASTGCEVDEEEDDDSIKKSASLKEKEHTYKVAIHTGGIDKTVRACEILNKSGYKDSDLYVNIANPDSLVVSVKSTKLPSIVANNMKDLLGQGLVEVNNSDISCCHDFCDCGEDLFDFPDMRKDDFVLIIPGIKHMYGENSDSLKEYAIANNYTNFKICASDGSSVYDTAMREALEEADKAMPNIDKDASEDDVFVDKNTGEVFNQQQVKDNPNMQGRQLDVKKLSTEINNMFLNGDTISLSTINKNILRAAMNYYNYKKLAYLSQDSFSIVAGEAVITVDNNKASRIPLPSVEEYLFENTKEEEKAKLDTLL